MKFSQPGKRPAKLERPYGIIHYIECKKSFSITSFILYKSLYKVYMFTKLCSWKVFFNCEKKGTN